MNETDIQKSILLSDGSRVVLVGTSELESNVFRLNASGDMAWQIDAGKPIRLGDRFTGIWIDEQGVLHAYRASGYEYEIDLNSGKAVTSVFAR